MGARVSARNDHGPPLSSVDSERERVEHVAAEQAVGVREGRVVDDDGEVAEAGYGQIQSRNHDLGGGGATRHPGDADGCPLRAAEPSAFGCGRRDDRAVRAGIHDQPHGDTVHQDGNDDGRPGREGHHGLIDYGPRGGIRGARRRHHGGRRPKIGRNGGEVGGVVGNALTIGPPVELGTRGHRQAENEQERGQTADDQRTTFLSRSVAISAGAYPNSRKTWSVCSPRSGAAVRGPGLTREKVSGVPMTGILPSFGCSTVRTSSRAIAWGSFITWSTVLTGVAGTPASSRHLSRGSRSWLPMTASRAVSSSFRCLTRSMLVAKRGSVAISGRPSAGARRDQNRSLAPAMKTHCPSRHRNVR